MKTSTHPFHDVQASKCADKVDGAENDLSNEAIIDSNTLEDSGTVVEKVVGTRQLLEALQRHAQEGAVPRFVCPFEAIEPSTLYATLRFDLVGNFVDLCLDEAI